MIYLILANGIPQSVPWFVPMFKNYMPHRAHFFHLVIFLNGYSSSAPVYFSLKGWNNSIWQLVPRRVYLYVILANGTPLSVPWLAQRLIYFLWLIESTFFFPIVPSSYFQRCLINCACLLLLKGCYIPFKLVGTPQSVPQIVLTFTIFFVPHRAHFF